MSTNSQPQPDSSTATHTPHAPNSTPGDKPLLNVLVIGNVDAGKSTAMGHLLHQYGLTDYASCIQLLKSNPTKLNSSLLDAIANSTQPGPSSYISLMQHLQATRSDHPAAKPDVHPDFTKFCTSKYLIHVIDVPGHRHFVSNLITGATRADVAILVVSASSHDSDRDDLLNGLGETAEHAMLACTLGIKQLLVAINKMDLVEWSQDVYLRVVNDVSNMLKKVGYLVQSIPFVPISGTTGHGLFLPAAPVMPWFTGWQSLSKSGDKKSGTTFIDAIDAIDAPRRISEKPLRISIQDIYKVSSVGTMPVGKIESGVLRPGMKVRFAPGNATGTVISVEARKNTLETPTSTTEAFPGDNVGFGVSNVSVREVRRGHICSSVDAHAMEAVSFTAQIIIMLSKPGATSPHTLNAGDEPIIMDAHTAHVSVRVSEILARIDRTSGQIVEAKPKAPLSPGDAAIIRCIPLRPLCIEPFAEFPSLGRIALRSSNRHTIAVGIVKSVDKRLDDGSVVTYPLKGSVSPQTAIS